MRRARAVRRIGATLFAAAAVAGATASPAPAAIGPACSTQLVAANYGASSDCSFNAPFDYATISVVTDGPVTVTLRCNGQLGFNHVQSRSFSKSGTWTTYTPGFCQLILTADRSGVTAKASATPATDPIHTP